MGKSGKRAYSSMYIGKYYHRIDDKNRVSFPVKLREQVGSGAIITRGLDGCLAIFDAPTWEKRLQEITNLAQTKRAHREYIRFLTNDAQAVEIDNQGRLRVSDELKTLGNLTKEVVFVGSLDHIEIWDQDKYHQYMSTISESIEETLENIDVS